VGYPSLDQVLAAASDLTFADGTTLVRTKGFWHVFIFLRAARLLNQATTLTFAAFDLAEPAFDLNGVFLPVGMTSRNVYYEPGASQGANPSKLFRHREGPRQTYLNRIQTGSLSGGLTKPNLFDINHSTLPVTVTLRDDWIDTLRSFGDNQRVLDESMQSFFTWVFRFGVPKLGTTTTSIALHQGNGTLLEREHLLLEPLPTQMADFTLLVQDFFGITEDQVNSMFPYLSTLTPQVWAATESIPLNGLREPLIHQLTSGTLDTEPAITAPPALPEGSPAETAIADSSDYELNWDCLLNGVLARLPEIPLVGVGKAAIQTIAALRAGKYVILLGPPGTGKTELASLICGCAVECGIPDSTMATATADWSTFETIGGYMPSPGDSGQLIFSENVFVESVRTGRWLVIDELNRADIDKAFGELFTLFSGNRVRLSYRIEGKPIVLLPPGSSADETSEHPIYLVQDWRMIGTMNTFDKASLFQLSYAFMRRFAFVDVPVPSRADYEHLLANKVSTEMADIPDVVRQWTAETMNRVFTFDAPGTLQALGLSVGPAIPLDILKYLKQRYSIDLQRGVEIDNERTLLAAMEMYLYPQFEGRNELHLEILNAVSTALSLAVDLRRQTGSILANWTGFEQQSETT
jgi:MoxR-like ATPase